MDEVIKKYNLSLKKLIEILETELPSNPLIETAKRKYLISITNDKSLLITETGPSIYMYREPISEDKWEELIFKDWSTDIQSAEAEQLDQIQCIIPTLQKLWVHYDDYEKKKIKKIFRSLISEYAKFLCLTHS